MLVSTQGTYAGSIPVTLSVPGARYPSVRDTDLKSDERVVRCGSTPPCSTV